MGFDVALLNRRRRGGSAPDAYAVLGYKPPLVLDFDDEYYRANSTSTTFSDALTHSASSNATMVDSDGLLKWRPHNLLLRSEEFDNASWGKAGGTVTANTIAAPDGTTTADLFTESAALETHSLLAAGTSVGGAQTVFSVFIKPNGRNVVRLDWLNSGSHYALVTLTGSGTVNSGVATVVALPDGWFQVSFTHTPPFSSPGYRIKICEDASGFGTVTYTGDGTSGIYIWGAHLYRSDLGGMVNNPDRGDSYVPTTSTARYLPRRGHHVYNGTSWVNEGLLHESEARTNLLHTTDALVTQSLTVTAVPHTLHFTGTGTVTLLGASTAGPLVGTGTGENNRVSLTFTPTAASLTLTVTGTVTNAQLEVGSTPSSYIPNLAASGSVTRAAETLTIPSAKLPYSATAMSIQMQGRATGGTLVPVRWYLDASNYLTQGINTSDFTFEQAASGTVDAVTGGSFTSGVNTAFNIASRHGSTFVNGAVDGTALTANTTPTALPNLSATDMNLAYSGGPMVLKSVRMWAADITDAGLEAATV